jgi:dihydroneopterin aldolase
MISRIYIKDLVVEGKHGVHPAEREQPQRFNCTVTLHLSSNQAEESDELADTVDYSKVRQTIITVVQNNSFQLLERLAREIATQLLADTRIQKAVVSIEKPDIFETGTPGVTIELTQTSNG